jgi:hypothetical protein
MLTSQDNLVGLSWVYGVVFSAGAGAGFQEFLRNSCLQECQSQLRKIILGRSRSRISNIPGIPAGELVTSD